MSSRYHPTDFDWLPFFKVIWLLAARQRGNSDMILCFLSLTHQRIITKSPYHEPKLCFLSEKISRPTNQCFSFILEYFLFYPLSSVGHFPSLSALISYQPSGQYTYFGKRLCHLSEIKITPFAFFSVSLSMAYQSSSKEQFRATLPPTSLTDRNSLSHSRSQSQLQTSAHAKLGPWAQWGHTSASLNGLETMKRPQLKHSQTTGDKFHFNRDPLPAIPGVIEKKLGRGSRRLDGRLNEYGDPVPKPSMNISVSMSHDDDNEESESVQRVARIHSSPDTRTLPPPPDPPLTKSATKVMQRTGYDPTMEIREGRSRQSSLHIAIDDSDSSGSIYSQEDSINSHMAHQSQTIGSAPVSPMQRDEGISYFSNYISSNTPSPATSSPRSLVISSEYKERVSRFMQGHLEDQNASHGFPCANDLEDLIGQEGLRYDNQNGREYPLRYKGHNDDIPLMPLPLSLPTKRSRQSYFYESPGDWESGTPVAPFFSSEEQPSLNRPSTVSYTSSMAPPNIIIPESNKPWKRDFSNDQHSLKSPFPFLSTNKIPDSPRATGPTGSLGERLSGAIKRLSGGTKMSPTEGNEIIYNASRSATGPDTPMPRKSGFMGIKGAPDLIQKGNEHFHEAVEKVKLKVNKKERRRRELKKQILVVGIMDQTPGQLLLSISDSGVQNTNRFCE